MKLRILLAEDHRMFREALKLILGREPDIEVVGEAGDGREVLLRAAELEPDIVCMDIVMPDLNGIEATRRLRDVSPQTKVIGLSGFANRQYVMDMLQAGAKGYVVKSEAGEELLRAIRAVHRDHRYISPQVANVVAESLVQTDESAAACRLTARERQVLQLVAEGHTTLQIGKLLHLAPATIEVHRRNMARKLGLRNVAEITRYAVRHGLVDN